MHGDPPAAWLLRSLPVQLLEPKIGSLACAIFPSRPGMHRSVMEEDSVQGQRVFALPRATSPRVFLAWTTDVRSLS